MNAFAAVLPKSAILNLRKNSHVGRIFLNDIQLRTQMDVASRTVRAAGVWGRGIDGSGVDIGILDPSNVDAANPFLRVSDTSRPGSDSGEHASNIASVAASFHDTYKGIAPGATIVSVGENGITMQMAHSQIAYRPKDEPAIRAKPYAICDTLSANAIGELSNLC